MDKTNQDIDPNIGINCCVLRNKLRQWLGILQTGFLEQSKKIVQADCKNKPM